MVQFSSWQYIPKQSMFFFHHLTFPLDIFFFNQFSLELFDFFFFLCIGVITRYEVFLRGPVAPQNHSTLANQRRVFYSSGWLDPSVSLEKMQVNGSEASSPENTTVIGGLQAFSTYQLRVVSLNSAGSVTSDWTTARTEEGGLYVR